MRCLILDSDSTGTAYPPHPNSLRAHLMNGAARLRGNARALDTPRCAYDTATERVRDSRRARRAGGPSNSPAPEPKTARQYPAYVRMHSGLFFVADGFADLYATDSEAEANAVGRSINRHRASER